VGWSWSLNAVSVLAWLTFAGLLIGRARLGWRGQKQCGFFTWGQAFIVGLRRLRFVLKSF
jgi:ABC-type uncharacterized transport system permease subunit